MIYPNIMCVLDISLANANAVGRTSKLWNINFCIKMSTLFGEST